MNKDLKSIKNLLFRVGSEVANEAKDKAPYRSGNLKRDIQVFDKDIDNLEISVGNSKLASYAPFVHQGTGKRARGRSNGRIKKGGIKAQPYLEDGLKKYLSSGDMDRALKDCGEDIQEEFKTNLKKSLKNVSIK